MYVSVSATMLLDWIIAAVIDGYGGLKRFLEKSGLASGLKRFLKLKDLYLEIGKNKISASHFKNPLKKVATKTALAKGRYGKTGVVVCEVLSGMTYHIPLGGFSSDSIMIERRDNTMLIYGDVYVDEKNIRDVLVEIALPEPRA
ncbi:hypothetical protein QVD17_31246 [Tagetes erecta]|uniref:Uncharacterized protein n=1 Tax=Tagetes erecta TaxID=13708 RepID=A0AAD8K321_TARER|nr:hypothetical protein QVD17_31246 [Tagetes erecta]